MFKTLDYVSTTAGLGRVDAIEGDRVKVVFNPHGTKTEVSQWYPISQVRKMS